MNISLAETRTQCRVVLEGRIVGLGVTELRTMCARLISELKGRALVIDMKDVMLISQAGENALLQLINHGAKLRTQGALARCLIQHLAYRSQKRVGDLIDTSPTSA